MALWGDRFSTLYVLLAGDSYVSVENFRRIADGLLAPSFSAFGGPTTAQTIVTYRRTARASEDDPHGADISTAPFTGIPVASSTEPITAEELPGNGLTGFVWHLYHRQLPRTDALVRAILTELRPPLEAALEADGHRVLALDLKPYGRALTNYRDWPTMPNLPAQPEAEPTPSPPVHDVEDGPAPSMSTGAKVAIGLALFLAATSAMGKGHNY